MFISIYHSHKVDDNRIINKVKLYVWRDWQKFVTAAGGGEVEGVSVGKAAVGGGSVSLRHPR